MKHTSLLTRTLALAAFAARAEDKPLLAIPGKVIFENKLSDGAGAPWKAAKGKWEAMDGVLRGSELAADKHGAVTRLPNKLKDFVIEYEFKFAGAKSTSLSINAVKDHMARISITPKTVTVQRDDNDHEGPDKAVVFARFPRESLIHLRNQFHRLSYGSYASPDGTGCLFHILSEVLPPNQRIVSRETLTRYFTGGSGGLHRELPSYEPARFLVHAFDQKRRLARYAGFTIDQELLWEAVEEALLEGKTKSFGYPESRAST